MSINSSTFSNDSSLPSELYCLIFKPSSSVFSTFTITNIFLLLPLSILVLYRGLQRWHHQHLSATAAATSTHSNSFTYHLVTMELINVFGSILCCYGIYENDIQMLMMWFYFFSITWYGETYFHILTCVEHYLAVVHPITYLTLRKERGIRVRNLTIGFIWVLCIGGTILVVLGISTLILDSFLLISSVVIISFCSFSVLWALNCPGPVERGKDRVRVNQSKRRAFYTIVAILGALLLRCIWSLVWSMRSVFNGVINKCLWIICDVWINLPSSLVLPLLYLQRTGT